jgi:hypothetical protein
MFHVDYVHLKLLRYNFSLNCTRSCENPLHIQRRAGRTPLRCTKFTSQTQLQGMSKLCEHFLQELYKGRACLQWQGSQWTMWGRKGQGRKIQTTETEEYDASFRAFRLQHQSNVNNCIHLTAFRTTTFRSLCIPAKRLVKSLSVRPPSTRMKLNGFY